MKTYQFVIIAMLLTMIAGALAWPHILIAMEASEERERAAIAQSKIDDEKEFGREFDKQFSNLSDRMDAFGKKHKLTNVEASVLADAHMALLHDVIFGPDDIGEWGLEDKKRSLNEIQPHKITMVQAVKQGLNIDILREWVPKEPRNEDNEQGYRYLEFYDKLTTLQE